jgi:osmoprotectant transport system permease protein
MRELNAEVAVNGRSFADVAGEFLADGGFVDRTMQEHEFEDPLWSDLRRNTAQHLKLTAIAMLGAVLFGVGLSLAVFRVPGLARGVLYIAGLLQTIPSIALLALMIPVLGIGPLPAIVALFLYSLLPILRNSITALTTLDPTLTRVAEAMGLSNLEQLRYVYVPLSLPSMLAGIRTAAVISIGTATLAAFIGAGGLGDPIVTGLALNDVSLILQGAIPAALLAIVTELLFELVERVLLPGHLRGS